MDRLIVWLSDNDRRFVDGVELYKELGTNRNLLRFYLLGENLRSKESLYYELNEARKRLGLKLHNTSVKVVKISPEAKIYVKENSNQNFSVEEKEAVKIPSDESLQTGRQAITLEEPKELEELTKKHAYLFRQKEILRLSLYDFPRNNEAEVIQERRMVMQQIIQYKAQISEIALKRKFYEKNGFFPEEIQDTKEQLFKKKANARSNISRQKSMMKNATSIEDREKAQKRLKQYEAELEAIELKINA